MSGLMAGQARADHGPRQRPVAGVGHCQAAWPSRAPSSPSATRARRSRSACARSPSSSAATCWSIATSATWPRSTATFDALAKRWDGLDFVVHAIGFSDKNELRGGYVDTSLDNFLMTMNISVYSFCAVAQRARRMMKPGGSLLTLSYYGAEKVIPHYNVMGVAKAALETSRQISRRRPRPRGHPRQRDQRRADQDAGGERHRRLPLHHEVERI